MTIDVTMPKTWIDFGVKDGRRKIRLGTEESKRMTERLFPIIDMMDGTLENDASGCVTVIPLGLGISIVDVSLEPLQIFNDKMPVPIESYGIMQGRYVGVGNDESSPYDLSILATSKEQLAALDGSRYVATPAGVHVIDGEGEDRPLTADVVRELVDAGELSEDALGIDFRKLWSMHHEEDTGRFTTNMYQIVVGIAFLRQLIEIVDESDHTKSGARTGPAKIRVTKEFPQLLRAKTRGRKTKGISLTSRNGEEITRITAIADCLDLKPSSRKTLLKLNQEATKLSQSGEYRHDGETVCRVVLSVEEVSEQYGITEASARKRLRRDFKAISNESITVKRGKNWATVPVAGDTFGISGDNAMFSFSPSFMQMMLNPKAPQVDLPQEIYGTDDTNYPAALQIGFKLYDHDNMNYGRPNQDRIKLATLLYAATEIPTAEGLSRSRRSKTERIMGPFEATMDHLVDKGVLKAWDYCHESGEPLTDEEYATIQTEHDLGKPTPWSLAEGLLVTWELGRRYPNEEEARQKSRSKRNAKVLEAKAKKEKEAKDRERRIRRKEETLKAKERHEASKKCQC